MATALGPWANVPADGVDIAKALVAQSCPSDDRPHAPPLPIVRQTGIVSISRGSAYDTPEPISEADLRLMRRIDELHLELPFAGARTLRDLRADGFAVARKRLGALMRRKGITAPYRKPNTSSEAPGHTIYPNLLHTLAIMR